MHNEYLSCGYIQFGMNFYPNNKIKICCFTDDDGVDAASTDDPPEIIASKLFRKKQDMIDQFKNGDIYDCCSKCPSLIKKDWGYLQRQINSITLNHYMFCNLKCSHCGYLEGAKSGRLIDTDHGRVLEIIKELEKLGFLSSNVSFDVGGGEPSVSDGLQEIVKEVLSRGHHVHINSNGAKYVELFASGVNKGLLALTLTPDAGSRETYVAVKGQDNFIKTWRNIEHYIKSCNGQVIVKFILQEFNINDIDNMIAKSAEVGAKHLALSLDLRISDSDKPSYVSYIRAFREQALRHSIQVRPGLVPANIWELSTPSQLSNNNLPVASASNADFISTIKQINAFVGDAKSHEMMTAIWALVGENFKEMQTSLPADQAMTRRELSFHDDVILLGFLCNLIHGLPGDIVEIGVWKGKSLSLMNEVCNHERRVIGIDPFELPNQLQEFMHYSNTVLPNALVIRGFSEFAAETFYELSPQVALLHIDGGHTGRNVLLDFLLYSPSVVAGGFIVFDDYADFNYSPEVGPAVDLLRAGGYFKDFHVLGRIDRYENSYVLQRKAQ